MRTRFLGTMAIAALLLAACGDDDTSTAADAAPGSSPDAAESNDGSTTDGFRFTDDLGNTVTLDELPDVIVASSVTAGTLWEYGIEVDGVYGPLRGPDGEPDPQVGLADPDEMNSLGEGWGEINIEQLHALKPDLIIDAMWGGEQGLTSHPQWDQLKDVAPHVAIEVVDTDFATIPERFADLAVALGADEDEVAAARAEYDRAVEGLQAAASERPEIDAAFVSATTDLLYLGVIEGYTDLQFFDGLGMNILQQPPSENLEIGGVVYWTELSWENAEQASADVAFVDTRTYSDVAAILGDQPTWQALPVHQAGQLGGWDVEPGYGYGNLARLFDEMAITIREADDVVS